MPIVATAQAITACDWKVRYPSDLDRFGPGVQSSGVDAECAVAVCRGDFKTDPDNPWLQ